MRRNDETDETAAQTTPKSDAKAAPAQLPDLGAPPKGIRVRSSVRGGVLASKGDETL